MKALAEKVPGGAAPGGMPALPKDIPRRPAPGPAEFAGAYGTGQQADPAGPRWLSRIGEEEVTSFVIASAAKQSSREPGNWIAS
jgi:hypothetical protein